MYKTLAWVALALCFIVVTFGAYVRLSDAGLGCPDWPGCYGELTPTHAKGEISKAESALPSGPVTMPKAWKEMIHRYLAGVLGVLIACMAFLSWANRQPKEIPRAFPTLLAGLVVLQALFGKWTVTLLLKPAIVTGHLLGGMLIFALLGWQIVRMRGARKPASAGLRLFAKCALLTVAIQIALGGWVSTNYAALACTDFPKCHDEWKPANMDFEHGFTIARELGKTKAGDNLSRESLTAIHWVHRVNAIFVALIVGTFAWRLRKAKTWRGEALGVDVLLAAQIVLGISNVWFSLPLPIAVAHNGVAALLLFKLVAVNAKMRA